MVYFTISGVLDVTQWGKKTCLTGVMRGDASPAQRRGT